MQNAAIMTRQTTLAGALWPSTGLARAVLLVAAGAVLLALSAKIKVPMFPVPMTLQTLVVALLGATYGARLGIATVLAYVTMGAVGLPVFTNTPPQVASLAYLLGPTGGYIVGWMGAILLIATLCRRGFDRSFPLLAAAIFAGSVVTFVCGVTWLALFAALPTQTGLGFSKALAAGYYPFILGDLIKITLAAALVRAGWRFVEGRDSGSAPL
ncbi:MAG: biotin transporter BioY [Pseudorhodoplanes sp.]